MLRRVGWDLRPVEDRLKRFGFGESSSISSNSDSLLKTSKKEKKEKKEKKVVSNKCISDVDQSSGKIPGVIEVTQVRQLVLTFLSCERLEPAFGLCDALERQVARLMNWVFNDDPSIKDGNRRRRKTLDARHEHLLGSTRADTRDVGRRRFRFVDSEGIISVSLSMFELMKQNGSENYMTGDGGGDGDADWNGVSSRSGSSTMSMLSLPHCSPKTIEFDIEFQKQI